MQTSPRAAVSSSSFFFKSCYDVITRYFLNTRFIHRLPLTTQGPSSKQAVSMATAACGHEWSPSRCHFQGGSEAVCLRVCVCVQRHVRLLKQPVALMGKVLIFILYNYKQEGCWAVIPGWIHRFFSYYGQQMEERTESCHIYTNRRTN